MMIHSTGFFFLVFFGAASAVICPSPFIALAENCYYFSDETATWHGAREACQRLSLPEQPVDLAVFDRTCEDYMHIFNHISSLQASVFWLGGTDEKHEDYWTWVDGRPIDMGKTYWEKEEPDQITNQNCLHTVYMNEYYPRWRIGNQDCSNLYSYVCQLGVQEMKF